MEVPINNDSTTTHLIMKVVINLQSTIKKKNIFRLFTEVQWQVHRWKMSPKINRNLSWTWQFVNKETFTMEKEHSHYTETSLKSELNIILVIPLATITTIT